MTDDPPPDRRDPATSPTAHDPCPSGSTALPEVVLRRSALFNLLYQYTAIALAFVHGFALVPAYIARIPIGLYGAWLATGGILAWVDLVDPGVSGTLQQRVSFHYGANDRDRLAGTIGSGLVLSAVLSAIPMLAYPFAGYVPPIVRLEGPDAAVLSRAFQVGLFGTSLSLLSYAFTAINVGLHRSAVVAAIHVIGALVGLGVTLVLLFSGWGLLSIPYGTVAKSTIILFGDAAQLALWCRRHMNGRPSVSRGELRELRGLLGFTFMNRLGNVMVERMEALIATQFFGPATAAVFVLTGRAYDALKMVTVRVAHGLTPGLAHLMGRGDPEKTASVIRRASNVIGWVTVAGVFCIVALNSAFVRVWVGSGLYAGNTVSALLGVAAVFGVLSGAFGHYVFALGEIRRTAAVGVAEGIVKLALTAALAYWIGLPGLPVATAAAAVLVGGRYLPRALDRSLAKESFFRKFWFRTGIKGVVFAGMGVIAALLLQKVIGEASWVAFFTLAAGISGASFLLLLVSDREFRSNILERLPFGSAVR